MNWTCETVESRLSEHLDGLLSAEEERSLAAHLRDCSNCSALIRKVNGMLSTVRRLAEVPEPPALVPAILDSTIGPRRARKRVWADWFGWTRPLLQPRMAMGLAVVSLTFFITADAVGLNLRSFEWKDLNPVNVYRQTNRQMHLLFARSVKFVNDLRVVYEIQTRLQTVSEREPAQGEDQKKKQEADPKRSRESNEGPRGGCDSCLVATSLGAPGGILR